MRPVHVITVRRSILVGGLAVVPVQVHGLLSGVYVSNSAAELGTNGSWPPEARVTPHIPRGLFEAFTHGLIVLNKALWGY